VADNELVIKVKVDSEDATRGLDGLSKKVDETGNAAEGAGGKLGSLAEIVKGSLSVALGNVLAGAAQAALDSIRQLPGALIALAERGDAINDVAASFERLAEKAGATSDILASQLREATQGTVDDFELMQRANKALTAGLDPALFDDLAAAAKRYADAQGIDTVEALDKFFLAASKGNEAQLAQLGLLKDGMLAVPKYNAELSAFAATQDGVGDTIGKVRVELKNMQNGLAKTVDESEFLRTVTAALGNLFLKAVSIVTNLAKAFIQLADKGLKFVRDEIDKTLTGLRVTFQIMGQLADLRIPDLAEAYANATKEQRAAAEQTARLAEELKNYDTSAELVVRPIEKIGRLTKEQSDALKKGTESWNANRDAMLSWGGFLGLVLTQAEQDVLDAAAAFNELTKGQTLLSKELTKLFGGDELGNSIAQSIEGSLADTVSQAFEGGNSDDFRKIFANLGGKLGSYFGPIGEVLGTELFDKIFSIFDKPDSPGTKARKSIDKLFADLFDANRLSVVVGDELRNIKDLDFSGREFGNPEAGFFDIFKSLPDAARAAFLGVAQAFTELSGNSQEFAGNIAAALTNNIGGSLNNLQLLIQASGVSAEELQGKLLQAFLDGEIAALEAQSAINGIAQTMQVGIPDGIGLTIQAFNNLVNAGVKGGRASTDALRDIGAEARELSITSIPALMAQLESTGEFTAQEIKQVFDALAAQGIDTIDELTNATDGQLLAVLSQLQATDFPFKQAAVEAQELIDKVNELPSEINTKLRFDVEVNASQSDREVLAKSSPQVSGIVGQRSAGLA
jgi:hypothetical protein